MDVMLAGLPQPTEGSAVENGIASALARASAAIARLDQTLTGHPLCPAFLYRARLEAVRHQAAVDGLRIDPWHLAALLEGLRLRMDPYLTIAERGSIFDAGRHAFGLHQWITSPDFDQEGEVLEAGRALVDAGRGTTPLIAGAQGMHAWLNAGGSRASIRAALIRFWMGEKVTRLPIPLTGAAALAADGPSDGNDWLVAFLSALAREAEDGLQLLLDLECAWFAGRAAVDGRRRHSRAGVAIDMLAASPLVSASSLAKGLGMAVPNAAALLNQFAKAGIANEVTHRSKRRLFGLSTVAPIRDGVAPPRRPEPGRGRGRPTIARPAEPVTEIPIPLPSLTPMDRRAFDYSDLEHWMANLDQTIRQTKSALQIVMAKTGLA